MALIHYIHERNAENLRNAFRVCTCLLIYRKLLEFSNMLKWCFFKFTHIAFLKIKDWVWFLFLFFYFLLLSKIIKNIFFLFFLTFYLLLLPKRFTNSGDILGLKVFLSHFLISRMHFKPNSFITFLKQIS